MMPKISTDDEVFNLYVFWTAVVLVKMLLVAPMTAFFRFKNRAPASPEDGPYLGYVSKGKATIPADPDVERVRRIHRNDLENITPYVCLAFFFTLTSPSVLAAKICFMGFALCRALHTLAYLSGVILVRAPAFIVGLSIMFYMAFQVLMTFA